MSDHPSRAELWALCCGGLAAEREREVLRHLLVCREECLDVLKAELERREPTPEEDAACEAAVGRAMGKALNEGRYVLQQREQARKILACLRKKGLEGIRRGTCALARMEALLARSWELRHEDPRQMVEFAWHAAQVSQQLDPRRFGPERVCDFQARAFAELGNAYRAADRLHEAADALGKARELFETRSSRDKLLEVRLLDLEASLAAEWRQFGRASARLLKVFKFYSRQNDFHLAGRALVKMGVYAGNAGEYEKAIRRLQAALGMVDANRDPVLAFAAAHNLILFLVESGRFAEARKLRLLHGPLLADPRGRVNRIKFRGLEAHIDFGLGRYQRAEGIFREVCSAYKALGLSYTAANESLFLGAALLAQGKAAEAATVCLKAVGVFMGLGIQREVLEAVILLRDAFQTHTVTLEMVLEVASFLRRLEMGQSLRFEGRAWEPEGEE